MKEIIIILISLLLLVIMISKKTKLINGITDKYFYSLSTFGYLFTRILLTIIIFLVFNRQGPGDLTEVFYKQALLAKYGKLIYNDFNSSYSVLLPYLLSLPLYISNHPVSIVFFFILFDLLVLFVSTRYIIPTFNINKKDFLWFFIFCPINFLFTIYYVQDEIIIAFFMVLAFALIIRQKQFWAIIILVLGFYFTKFISIYFFIPLLLIFDKKYFFAFFVGIIIPSAFLYLFNVDLLMPLKEGEYTAIGPNLWTLLDNLGIDANPKVSYSILLIITSILIIFQIRTLKFDNKIKFRFENILKYILLYSLIFMSFSRKSFSFYFLITIVFFLILIIIYHKSIPVESNRQKIRYYCDLYGMYIYLFLISILYVFSDFLRKQNSFNFLSLFSFLVILLTFVLQIKLIYQIVLDLLAHSKNEDDSFLQVISQ